MVSVIIPLFNAEKYIIQCINSVLNQTYTAIEIIVVNDGSTDQSFEIVSQLKSDKLILINQKNAGASSARNAGLKIAKGKYIQFLDADDFLSTNKIEEQVKLLEQNPGKLALCHTIHFFDGEKPKLDPITHDWFAYEDNLPIDFLIKLYGGPFIGPNYGGMIQPNAWLCPKTIIDKAGNWDETISLDDDGEFFCRVVLNSSGIVYAFEGVNFYRKFKNNSSLSSFRTYKGGKSELKSVTSKYINCTKVLDNVLVRDVFSKQFWAVAFNNYPQYSDIHKEASRMAKKLSTKKLYPLEIGGHKIELFRKIFGWKLAKRLLHSVQKNK
jgi:glycosyltransferase involved in cell wall biosynthesis